MTHVVVDRMFEARLDSESLDALRLLLGMRIAHIQSEWISSSQASCELSNVHIVAIDSTTPSVRMISLEIAYELEWTPKLDIGFSRLSAKQVPACKTAGNRWYADEPRPLIRIDVLNYCSLPGQQRRWPDLRKFEEAVDEDAALGFYVDSGAGFVIDHWGGGPGFRIQRIEKDKAWVPPEDFRIRTVLSNSTKH